MCFLKHYLVKIFKFFNNVFSMHVEIVFRWIEPKICTEIHSARFYTSWPHKRNWKETTAPEMLGSENFLIRKSEVGSDFSYQEVGSWKSEVKKMPGSRKSEFPTTLNGTRINAVWLVRRNDWCETVSVLKEKNKGTSLKFKQIVYLFSVFIIKTIIFVQLSIRLNFL